MKTYKNKHFTKRDYECTNVVFCTADNAPNHNWTETSDPMPATVNKLWMENGVQFYGWL